MAAQAPGAASPPKPVKASGQGAPGRASPAVFGSWATVLAVAALAGAALFIWHHGRRERELAVIRRLVRDPEPTVAMDRLEKFAARSPESAEVEYLFAVTCRRAQRFDLVEPHLSLAAKLGWDPKQIDRQRHLMFFQAGDFLRSGGEVKQMMIEPATDDEADEHYEAMTRGYMAGLLFQEAKFMLAGWLEWRPDSVIAHFLEAELAILMEDQEAEITAYREVLRVDPRNFQARRLLGRALTLAHENEEAYELLTACQREKPDQMEVLLDLADWYHRNGQQEAAAKHLSELLAAKTSSRQRALALTLLGQIDIERGEHEQAAVHLREAVESDPANMGAIYSLSQALSRAGRREEAGPYFDRWEQLQASEKKLEGFHDAIMKHPDDPDLRASIGEALLEKGETNSGVNWLLSALFHDRSHVQANRILADHYQRLGQTELAARHRAVAEATAEHPAPANPDRPQPQAVSE